DADHREALSLGHTGGYLASLALSRALAGRWSKDVPVDDLGSPNFDSAAHQSSRILERGSHDVYLIGKSLRKRAFVTEGLADAIGEVEASVNRSLSEWIATDAPVRIDRDGDGLTDRRYWVCALAEGEVRIPCGGTHATSLAQLGSLR